MLGEISTLIEDTYAELEELRDQRDMFVLANDETMPEFLYNKKLSELDERIARTEERIDYFLKEKEEIIDSEVSDMENDDECENASFEEDFEGLSLIDGIGTAEQLDDTADVEDLEAADRQARFDQYGETE